MSDTKSHARNRRATREFWRKHVESWEKSGLSQVQYCKENDLNKYTFGYHKSKFNKRDDFRPFLPVSIKSDKARPEVSFSSGVSLSFANSVDIQLEVGFNSDTLRRVIDLLEDRSCSGAR